MATKIDDDALAQVLSDAWWLRVEQQGQDFDDQDQWSREGFRDAAKAARAHIYAELGIPAGAKANAVGDAIDRVYRSRRSVPSRGMHALKSNLDEALRALGADEELVKRAGERDRKLGAGEKSDG